MKPLKFHTPWAMIWIELCISILLMSQALAQESAPPSVLTPLAKKHEASELKAAVLELYPQLSPLQPWQERLWQEEVLPHHLRFIKDYRALPSGIKAEVDLPAIRNFLKFYAHPSLLQTTVSILSVKSTQGMKSPQSLQNQQSPLGVKNAPKLSVFLNTQTPCEKCTQSLPQIKAYVASTVESRGLTPVWVTPQELGLEAPREGDSEPLEARLAQVAQVKKSFGFLIVSWNPASEEEIDTAHADEKRYWVDLDLSLNGAPRIHRKKEILDNEGFLLTINRLMIDVFTDLGAQMGSFSSLGEADLDSEEILIELHGERDFNQYSQVKTQLTELLSSYGSLQDRVLSKNEMTFVLPTKTKVKDIQRIVLESKSQWDPARALQLQVHADQ